MNRQPPRRDAFGRSRRAMRALDVALVVAAMAGVTCLVLEHGFGEKPPLPRPWLHAGNAVVVALLILDRLLRTFLAGPRWKEVLRRNWADYALICLLGVGLVISAGTPGKVLGIGAAYVVVTQVYILLVLLLRWSGLNLVAADIGLHPAKLFLLSFAVLCLVGSGLLMLPAARPAGAEPTAYVDALFTAVSATCVTGLIVKDTGSDWTLFGQMVILVLIQLGGLGVMMFGTLLALMIGRSLSLRGSHAMGEMVAAEGLGHVVRVIRFVVVVTLMMELAGTGLLYMMYSQVTRTTVQAGGARVVEAVFTPAEALWQSFFHSVSAFCNAGFSLHDANLMAGLEAGWDRPLRDCWQVMGVFTPMIILGGLGFPVLQDVWTNLGRGLRRLIRRSRRVIVGEEKRPRIRLSLHTKVVLTATAVLLVLGTGMTMLLWPLSGSAAAEESPFGWSSMGWAGRLRASLFLSVTARTAGFNTIEMAELSPAGKLWICALMSIGGSPAGTAGGMKTVTFALLLASMYAVLRRREEVEIFRRTVAGELVRKALTVAVLYMMLVFATTMGLLAAMGGTFGMVDLLFEACSACGTVGLSTGVTSALTVPAKLMVVFAMFAGRLGPVTLLVALTAQSEHVRYAYPTEKLTIG